MEQRCKERIEQEVMANNEREIQQKIGIRLAELRQSDLPHAHDARIQELEEARNKLAETRRDVDGQRLHISSQTARFVEFLSSNEFLESDDEYLASHRFSWPNVPSVDTFYTIAAMLLPQRVWDTQVRNEHSIHVMKKNLQDYIGAEKEFAASENYSTIDALMAIFNGSCDLIQKEEERIKQMDVTSAQAWIDVQDNKWKAAQSTCVQQFNLNTRSLIEQARLLDEFTGMYRGLRDAEKKVALARQTA